ncbi:MAG: hypothetical protein KJN92_14790 [Gemmatimonadetes bacterium]|nr:hypothetical protein [Gemmatimonadota bacterium]
MDNHDLTPEEKMALQRLPREAEPSRILEERVVQSLREGGFLEPSAGPESGTRRAVRGSSWYRPWMAAASVAASVVLFASGVVLGQWMGARSTTQAFIQVRDQDATQLALRIQEAGSAYVSALAALGELGVGGDEGREVALGALYGAANELARMSPEDADVLRVLQILEDRRDRDDGWEAGERNVVWF